MLILFDGERLETALPNVPAAAIVLVITSRMRIEHPVHPLAQIAESFRPDDEVKMVRHQAIPEYPHRYLDTTVRQRLQKSFLILVLVENALACVAAIDHVVASFRRQWLVQRVASR